MRKALPLVLSLVAAACVDPVTPERNVQEPLLSSGAGDAAAELSAQMDATNATLAASGAGYRLAVAEFLTQDGAEAAGTTILQKDLGNKQLSADFVPRDPRRTGWSGLFGSTDDISYAIDQTTDAVPTGNLVSAAAATAAIVRGMDSWDAASCSTLPLTRNSDFGLDVGLVAFQLSGGAIGSPFVFADVQHAGWRDLNFAGGVLGVTFTFVFTDNGVATDIDNNKKADVAFREIYYDPSWVWRIDGNIDIESVAAHEAGHGLSQAHFGNIVQRNDGSFDASPRAVMNAFYNGPFAALAGTDLGGHCSNWAAWPNQ